MSRSHSRAISLAVVVAICGACRHGSDHAAPSARPSPSGTVRTEDGGAAITRVENSTAEAVEQRLRITGLTSAVRHLHGGPPAKLGEATFEVQNRSAHPHRVRVSKVTHLRAHPCGNEPNEVINQLEASGIVVERQGNYQTSRPQITVGAGQSATLHVGFSWVEAYQVFCDYFSFRVTFLIDDQVPLVATAVTEVTRVTPRRP
jgi:hypothetical protein